ncbi:MAG: glycoside hydrolase family 92 protein [Bacteroidales bacterium]|nr:MAG: glycoside hydrolase family 92 protein [Bacteroidales bacterium]
MLKKKLLSLLLVAIAIMASAQMNDPAKFVNPFIGTDFHGHTYPGATIPFGMVQLSPDTRLTGWDGCSGYHYSDRLIYGFTHTHLSGTGCLDLGDILIMPTVGKPEVDNTLYSSPFKKESEKAKPGFYSVYLDKPKVLAELTATARVGFHRYTYPKTKEANIILDLQHRDEVLSSWIQIVGNNEVRGYRQSKSWTTDQRVYFVIRFSTPFALSKLQTADGSDLTANIEGGMIEGKNLKAWFKFGKIKGNTILVKVGISSVSVAGAIKNLEAETPDWDFDKTVNNAYALWNKELSKILIDGGTPEQMTTFYSALYHSMVVPNIFSDVDGRYLAMDKKIYKAEGFTPYTVFSLWDTYRAWHPLMTIIDTKRTNDYINTFLSHYKYGGLLPVWELNANETFCMIGYHSVPVIVDAWVKGIKGFDVKYAFEAMKHSSNLNHYGLEVYRKHGYIPGDKESESISKTLEYAYDDWCIAQMAKSLGKWGDYKEYMARAQFYKNIFDPTTSFMRPRYNGGWKTPFNPTDVDNNFTEANSWQYSLLAPQDISGLMKLHGGLKPFEAKIDELFNTSASLSGRDQSDITGLIGQYAHGNEPSHHMAYLYNFVGSPWKTQRIAREIMDEMYTSKPDGLCGNEDCGQMSAWYVLSAMGIYAVCPGNTQYAIGSPLFKKTTINLENGKAFTITAENNSKENIFIKEAYLNGKPLTRSWVEYSEILNGGDMKFVMSNMPNKEWASSVIGSPKTQIESSNFTIVPYFDNAPKTFIDSLTIGISTLDKDQIVYYSVLPIDSTEDRVEWRQGNSLTIKQSSGVLAYSVDKVGNKSYTIEGKFFRYSPDKTITIKSNCSTQYDAGGPNGLVDGIRGDKNFRLGGWQGYQGQDFVAIVDMGITKAIAKLAAGFLQDASPWIWLPRYVEYWTSDDGQNFTLATTVKHDIPENQMTPTIYNFEANVDIKARFIKVIGKYFGTIPGWHPGIGNQSWIFIDEIIVE